MREPKKVPAERIETMSDLREEGMTNLSVGVFALSYKNILAYGEAACREKDEVRTRPSKVSMK